MERGVVIDMILVVLLLAINPRIVPGPRAKGRPCVGGGVLQATDYRLKVSATNGATKPNEQAIMVLFYQLAVSSLRSEESVFTPWYYSYVDLHQRQHLSFFVCENLAGFRV